MYRYLSIGLLLAAIVLVGILVYQVLAVFFVPLFLAALLVVVFRPMHRRILVLVKNRKKTAALLSTIVILMLVLLPVALLGVVAVAESRTLIRAINPTDIGNKLRALRDRAGLEMPASDQFRRLEGVIEQVRDAEPTNDSEKQRTQLLYDAGEIRSLARDLATVINLPWPDENSAAATEADSPAAESHWSGFARKIENIRFSLKDETRWNGLNEDEKHALCSEMSGQLSSAIRDYFAFKTDRLGGPIRGWLTEIANPDEAKAREYVSGLTSWAREKLVSFGGATTAFAAKFLFGLVIMVLALFTFFLDGPALLDGLNRLTPLDNTYKDELIHEFEKVSRSVVLAILLAALAQGILGAVGYYLAGLESVFLLMMLTMALALVPFLGAAAIWVPCAFYLLFVEGRTGAGIFLAIYGVGVISMIDNVVKPLVLQGQSNLHPLLALLSILGGVASLGPIGIVVGPMVVVFLETLLSLLQRELVVAQQQHQETEGRKPAST